MNLATCRITFAAIVAALTLISMNPRQSGAAIESRDTLKTYFETGDVPTQDQFGDVIDSYIHEHDDGIVSGTLNSPGGLADRLLPGAVVGGGVPFGPPAGLSSDWSGNSGFLGLSFELNSELHYGYLHILTDVNGTGALYPITIDRFVFENTPGAPLTVSAVPEPASWALLLLGSGLLASVKYHRRNRSIAAPR